MSMPPTLEDRLDVLADGAREWLAEGLREPSRDGSGGEDDEFGGLKESLAEFFEKLDIGECWDPPDWETWSLKIILAPNNRSCSAPSQFVSVVMLMSSARDSICFATMLHMLVLFSRAVFNIEVFLAVSAVLLGGAPAIRVLVGEGGGLFADAFDGGALFADAFDVR